jgi:hypothetical protein
MIKIRVGLPSYDGRLRNETTATLKRLVDCKEYNFEICRIDGGCVYRGRNASSLAIPGIAGGKRKQIMPYDYYLAMDWDMSFGIENVKRLIASGKDIISGAYGDRTGTSDKLIAGYYDKIPGDCPMQKRLDFWNSGLKEVDWVGAGCLLIKKSVFETMDYPYWTHNVITLEKEDFREIVSEDVSFCMNARAAGFKIWCDLDNRIAHLAHPNSGI